MTRRLSLVLVVLLTAALQIACATAPVADGRPRVDLLITGGTVVTMAGPNVVDGAVAIRAGAIVDVGTSAELEARYAAADRVNAAGKAVLPGLINAHTHVPMVLFRGIADDRELMDWLQNFIFPAEAKNVDAEFVKWGTRLAAAEMIRSGTTTFADMYYFEADIAREVRAAGMRGVLGETMIDFPAPDNKTWDEATAYVRRYVAEFKNDPLITAALAPHAPFTVSKEHLQEVRRIATELGAPILIHLSETTDEVEQIRTKTGMTPAAYLQSIGFLGDDVVAAHGVWITPEEYAMLAAADTSIVHCPESNMMLASGAAPVAALRDAKVDVGLGTDGPAGSNNNLDMFEEMASAARLQKIAQKNPRALSARAVLEMATINGARALNMESKIGSIEKGKRADLIIVDLDGVRTQPVYSIESAIVYAASGGEVVSTIVEGRFLMRDRRLLTVDAAAALAKAKEYRDRVVSSIQTK
ncbi:MAG: amidohydrolase [Thermoanaerobaculia bacterium]